MNQAIDPAQEGIIRKIDPSQEGIIRKIQKLFNLANHAEGNEEAASAALIKAHELLAAHNLSLAVVQDTVVKGGIQNGEAVIEKREQVTIKRSAMYKWQRRLWSALAHTNYCFHWVHDVREGYGKEDYWGNRKPRWVKRHVILGKESNVVVVNLMGEYLCDTIERLCPYPQQERCSRSAISWKEGVADRLVERMQDRQREEEEDDVPPTSPGLLKIWKKNHMALALKDLRTREYEANYDAVLGAGAYKEKQEERKKAAAEAEEAEKRRIEALQNESPAEKKARERREEKARIKAEVESERNYRRQLKERLDDAARTDWRAYDNGKVAGERISLEAQVGGPDRPTKSLMG